MNKLIRFCCVAALTVIMGSPAMAVDLPSELIYRTNLGRAADVQYLLEQGASANQINEEGIPVLLLAAGRRDDEGLNVLKVLLASGANINGVDRQGQTALFYAAKQGNKDTATYLMEKSINYYALDRHGDIARTIAHQSGHDDIVVMMDNYVNDQTRQVNAQYAQANKAIQDNYDAEQAKAKAQQDAMEKQVQDVNKQIATMNQNTTQTAPATDATDESAAPDSGDDSGDEAPAEAPKPKAPIAPEAVKAPSTQTVPAATTSGIPAVQAAPVTVTTVPEPVIAAGPTKAEIYAEIMSRRKSAQFQTDIHEYVFNSCSYQYWYYCQHAGQSSELSAEELQIAIQSHKDQIVAKSTALEEFYKLDKDYTRKLSDNSKERIFNQLESMPSNTYRHEQGVGKMDDMKQRCELISDSWEQPPEPLVKEKDVEGGKGGGGGGIGKTGGSGKGGKGGKGGGKGGKGGGKHHGAKSSSIKQLTTGGGSKKSGGGKGHKGKKNNTSTMPFGSAKIR